ncbi:carbohydrate ABC transporter permease [Allofournierella sp.]|uniref:carbohydrate ABC transporter permease n=1 Tax=Allofournierella sp. TaxID=1940256 RepID=UPI003AB5DE8A
MGKAKGGLCKRKPHNSPRHAGYWFVLPLTAVILVFLVYPIAKAALMSVQYWYLPKASTQGNYFVGTDNFTGVLQDDYFWKSIRTTLSYMGVTIVARYLLGLGTAVLLNQKFPGRVVARALVIIPWAVPEVVASLVWILMYDKDFGIINYLFTNFQFISQPLGFLTDTRFALWAADAVAIWKGFPFVAIMLLSGLQSVPGELYEAARIDGANALGQFRFVTLPSLKPVSVVVFLLLVIWTIKDFGIIYLLAKGGPSRATQLLPIYTYQMGFSNFDFGRAAASGMFMLLFSVVFTLVYLNKVKEEDE